MLNNCFWNLESWDNYHPWKRDSCHFHCLQSSTRRKFWFLSSDLAAAAGGGWVVAPSFPGLELRTWTARVLSELEGWLRRHSPLTTSGAGGPRPFCKITTQRINLLRLIQHFKNRKAKCDLRKWLKLTFVLLDHLGKSHLKSSFLAFQNLMTLWTFLISTECALMRPLTYDNHPSIPTQPSSPHIALKTTSRELKNALRCIRTHWDSVRCSDYMSWNTHFCLKNCGRAFFFKKIHV